MATQKQRLREAIDALYKDPADMEALGRAERVLTESEVSRDHGGKDDGSVSVRLWLRRQGLVKAFAKIQSERQTLDETEDA